MEACNFEGEWKDLLHYQRMLADECSHLERDLVRLASTDEMQELFRDRDALRKKITELQAKLKDPRESSYSDERLRSQVRYRRKAMTERVAGQECAQRLKKRKERLEHLKSLQAPDVILQKEQDLIFLLEAPIDELPLFYARKRAEELEGTSLIPHEIDSLQDRIEELDLRYRETKKDLERRIGELKVQRTAHANTMTAWTLQSKEHVRWILEHEPMRASECLRMFRGRHPHVDLTDVISIPAPSTRQTASHRRQPKPLPPARKEGPPEIKSSTWSFAVVFDESDVPLDLPHEERAFVIRLQEIFHERDYRQLDPALVYSKLQVVACMTVQQRQEIRKITSEPLLGWKILRAGRKHRLFLRVDEARMCIAFLPHKRRTSYNGH